MTAAVAAFVIGSGGRTNKLLQAEATGNSHVSD